MRASGREEREGQAQSNSLSHGGVHERKHRDEGHSQTCS